MQVNNKFQIRLKEEEGGKVAIIQSQQTSLKLNATSATGMAIINLNVELIYLKQRGKNLILQKKKK